jgi:hypothetical protein
MSLTDPESFGQVVERKAVTSEVESYEEAFSIIADRLEGWKKENIQDQAFARYVDNLKEQIIENQDKIASNAAMQLSAFDDAPRGGGKVWNLDEFKTEDPSEAIFVDLQKKLNEWVEALEDGILKFTIKATQKFMHENKNVLATSLQHELVENQEKEEETKEVITNGHATSGSEDSKSTGGAPKDESTMPQSNVAENTEEKKEDVEVKAEVEVKKDEPTASGKSSYRNGGKKDFIWYKDTHSKEVAEVPREQGVQASGITEFKPSQAKMETDNPVPREMGVGKSEVSEYNVSDSNKVDMAKPVEREEGVSKAPKEFIKMQENSEFRSTLRAVLKAIKESNEI